MGKIRHTYNFPTDNLSGGVGEILKHVTQIFEKETDSFKLNIAFGFVMRNKETGQLRYYVPYENVNLFPKPFAVTDSKSLLALKRKLTKLNPKEHLLNIRKNTKWEPLFFTNINYSVYLMAQRLGSTTIELPRFVKNNKHLVNFVTDVHGKEYNDNLCFFRSLAYSKHKKRYLQKFVKQLLNTWGKYKNKTFTPQDFKGVAFKDFPELEECFQTNINAFELQEDENIISHYHSIREFPETLNLNVQGNHLSFITSTSHFLNKHKCAKCFRLFKTHKQCVRHHRFCTNVTKETLQSGFYTLPKTIFQSLSEFGIEVPTEKQFYDFFAVFDFESILQPERVKVSDKIHHTHNHQPISVAISSNFPGFQTAKCFLNSDLDTLLGEMLSYLEEIRNGVVTELKESWKDVFDKLSSQRDQFKPPENCGEINETGENLENEWDTLGDSCDETDFNEPASTKFTSRIKKPNVFREMLQNISEEGEIRVNYNDFSSEHSDSENETEDLNGDNSFQEAQNIKTSEIKFKNRVYKSYQTLIGKLEKYLFTLPILGLNSGSYDLCLIKSRLAKHLNLDRKEEKPFVIKRNNRYMQIENSKFKFLDISNYLAPGCSYSKFLKMFDVAESKSFFAYEYLSHESVLRETTLPSYDSFFSSLKNMNVLEADWISQKEKSFEKERFECLDYLDVVDSKSNIFDKALGYLDLISPLPPKLYKTKNGVENYLELKRIWKSNGFKSIADWLKYYNVLDVRPFVEGIERFQCFYKNHGKDVFKTSISLPGISRRMLFENKSALFSLPGERNRSLYRKLKTGIVGGPSIIFSRFLEKGRELASGKEICQSVIGMDANSLYPYCLMQDQPSGVFVRRLEENDFKPVVDTKYLDQYVWLDYISQNRGIRINHKLNSGSEKRVDNFLVDGYYKNEVFEFLGCYFHGCKCIRKVGEKQQKLQETRYDFTMQRLNYLSQKGLKVTSIWECDFKKNISPLCVEIRDNYLPKYYRKNKKSISFDKIIKDVKENRLFGCVECDLKVPSVWKGEFKNKLNPHEYFSIFPPIFLTTSVPFESFGEHMQQHCQANGLSKEPRKLLISCMSVHKILLATPLLKWYLEHGLEVTRIYEVVEYGQSKCFKGFIEKVADARRTGDISPDKTAFADTMKLLANSAYGSLLLSKEKYTKTEYISGLTNAKNHVNKSNFRDVEELSEDFFEFTMGHKNLKLNTPIQCGYWTLQLAKLRLLEFTFDALDFYVERKKYQLAQCDTDSLYFGISHNTLLACVKPHLKKRFVDLIYRNCNDEKFEANGFNFFPRDCCPRHSKYDSRTPGLFKLESSGIKMLSLCSKTYCLVQRDDNFKISCKGVSKKFIKNPCELFSKVLSDQKAGSGKVKGFINKDSKIKSYTMERNAFSYFYVKREVQSDGITTIPLSGFEPTPWFDCKNLIITDSETDALSLNHRFNVKAYGIEFGSILDLFLYECALHHGESQYLHLQRNKLNTMGGITMKNLKIKPGWFTVGTKKLKAMLEFKLQHCDVFKTALITSKGKHLVYCTEKMKFFSCGLKPDVAELTLAEKFPDQNQYGEVLMEIRQNV